MQVSDAKGDTAHYPKAVLSLPFSDQGNTYFFNDNYDLECKTASQNTTGGSKVLPAELCSTALACWTLLWQLSFALDCYTQLVG